MVVVVFSVVAEIILPIEPLVTTLSTGHILRPLTSSNLGAYRGKFSPSKEGKAFCSCTVNTCLRPALLLLLLCLFWTSIM